MRNRLIFKKYFFLVALVSLLFISCEKEELLQGPERLFRPIVKESVISGTWFRVVWDRYQGAVSYEMELSTDTFKTILKTYRTDSTAYTFTDLEYDLSYQMRIRSVGDSIIGSGDSIRSAYHVYNIKTIDYPTYLKAPASSDVLDNSVRVKWTLSAATYTRFDVMITRDSLYKSYAISDTENQTGEKIISGLEPGTTYLVMIYEGDLYKGKKTFKTSPAQVFSGDVVDLRDSTEVVAQSLFTQAYFDNLAILHPSGYNLILSGGATYTLPTINISVPVNMVTGLSFKGKAIIAVNGSFGITTNTAAKVSKLRFEKIFFTQGTAANKLKTDANYGGAYLINMNQTDGNVDTIILESCDVKYKRGVIRMQTKATIGFVKINNCLFDSIGGYGIVNNGNDLSRINDIVVSKSTILHADKFLVCGKTLSVNSISVSQVTTCFTPAASSYFLDYNTNAIPGGVSITNSLFGPGVAGAAVNGMRFSTTTIPSVTVADCFKTSDLVWSIPVGGTAPSYPIADLMELGKTSTDIFASPTTSNYKVSLTSLVNKVGDPRWW